MNLTRLNLYFLTLLTHLILYLIHHEKNLINFIVLGLLFSAQLVHAQGKFNLEFYGGGQRSYNQVLITPSQPSIDPFTPMDYNLGLNFLTRINSGWQLSVQAEHATSRTNSINYPNYPNLSGSFERMFTSESFGNFSLGARYNWEKEKYGFYLQPSIGITVDNYFDFSSGDSISGGGFIASSKTQVTPNLRLEMGFKLYTKRQNYFLIGLRHQQGLSELNPISMKNTQDNYQVDITRRGSYTSLFVGYGINFDNWKKSRREEFKSWTKDSKEVKRDLAWSSGPYLMASGFLRFRPRSERAPNLEFSHITSGSTFGVGYRFDALSIETGYNTIGNTSTVSLPEAGLTDVLSGSTIHAIPLTVKYDFLIGDKNRLRVGPTLSANFIVGNGNQGGSLGGFGGPDYSIEYTRGNLDLAGKVFFNAGAFVEVPIFNSSLINLKLSQNFGSPKVAVIDVTGVANGNAVNRESSGSLNGFMMELGYKLPLNLLFKSR